MKSAFLLAENESLFADARDVLVRDGAAYADGDGGTVQGRDPLGRLLTMFGDDPPGFEWEYREGPFTFERATPPSDMATIHACVIECRFEDLFAATTARIAAALPYPVWVLDSNGTIWDAASVDPERVRL
jgi:hypothetical protein